MRAGPIVAVAPGAAWHGSHKKPGGPCRGDARPIGENGRSGSSDEIGIHMSRIVEDWAHSMCSTRTCRGVHVHCIARG